jgi:hypothetical protein
MSGGEREKREAQTERSEAGRSLAESKLKKCMYTVE